MLYILSHGHSGSTLLDKLLGTHPDAFSTGELKYLPFQIYRDGKMCELKQDLCTCDKAFKNCDFWSRVINNIKEKSGVNLAATPLSLPLSFIEKPFYNSDTVIIKIIKRLILYIYAYTPSLFRLLALYYRKRAENNRLLYDCIAEVSGAKIIIDSSKDPLRYVFLRYFMGEKIIPIVLIRDLKGVYNSYKKLGYTKYKTLAANWQHFYRKRVTYAISHQPKNSCLDINYEELISQPQQTINKIIQSIGYTAHKLPNELDKQKHHMVGGNPGRYTYSLVIKPDESWTNNLTPDERTYLNKFLFKIT